MSAAATSAAVRKVPNPRSILLLAFAVTGCSSWWPFGGSSEETNRVPAGAVEYVCAQGKRLYLRLPSDGNSAWVILPEREFRLARSAEERYTNATTTLSLPGDSATLDVEGQRLYADCKRKPG